MLQQEWYVSLAMGINYHTSSFNIRTTQYHHMSLNPEEAKFESLLTQG